MTTEDRNAKARAYYKVNKEKVLARQKTYYQSNKESHNATKNKWRQSLKDKFYTLYYLTEHHYVGVTNQPRIRMVKHRVLGRITRNYEVIATFKTKREALDAEKHLHSIGYEGAHKQSKLTTKL
tara:strand:+ start:234 stop:605 length:372 start_codon:yes stop_codon:yes gene_type:complete